MKRLQAALRDRAAQSWKGNRVHYKVGSYFKGCENCGEKIFLETASGKEVVRFKSGYQVFRAYKPSWVGYTYWCYECGAKDLQCWGGALDIGKEPIVGARDAVAKIKSDIRKDRERNSKPETAQTHVQRAKQSKIENLEQKLEMLSKLLNEKL